MTNQYNLTEAIANLRVLKSDVKTPNMTSVRPDPLEGSCDAVSGYGKDAAIVSTLFDCDGITKLIVFRLVVISYQSKPERCVTQLGWYISLRLSASIYLEFSPRGSLAVPFLGVLCGFLLAGSDGFHWPLVPDRPRGLEPVTALGPVAPDASLIALPYLQAMSVVLKNK